MREINYTVGVDSISPSTVRFGGFAGEDCATRLKIYFKDDLKSAVEVSDGNTTKFLLEVIDGSGEFDSYPLTYSTATTDGEPQLTFDVPKELTELGGRVTLQLSIIEADATTFEAHRKILACPIKLRFAPSTSGEKSLVKYKDYSDKILSAMLQAKQAAEAAKENADNTATSESNAATSASEAANSATTAAGSATAAANSEAKAGESATAAAKAVETVAAYKKEAESAKSDAELAASQANDAKNQIDEVIDDKLELATGELKAEIYETARVVASDATTASEAATASKNSSTLASDYANQANQALGEMQAIADDVELWAGDVTSATPQALDAALRAEAAADRAEAAAGKSWAVYKTVTLESAAAAYSEQVELVCDTSKGLCIRVILPANTALHNNRLAAYISLNGNRQLIVRGESWATSDSETVGCFIIRPVAEVWNAEVAPYVKTVAGIVGNLNYAEGDKVRYVKFQTNEDNPIPAGTKFEFWGLQ